MGAIKILFTLSALLLLCSASCKRQYTSSPRCVCNDSSRGGRSYDLHSKQPEVECQYISAQEKWDSCMVLLAE